MPSHPDPVAAHDQATLDFYADHADTYVSTGKDTAGQWLGAFARLVPAGGRILDLGCGGGRDAAMLLDLGFDVDAADGSPAMASKAAERLGRAVKVMRFDELSDTNMYDAVWANASLLHVPRAALPDVLARVFRALKPGGYHFASYKAGSAPGRDGLGRFFNYLCRDSLSQAYPCSAPWHVISLTDHLGGGYEGALWPWLAITAQRPR
jgi:SAM-dependent methyltransferase